MTQDAKDLSKMFDLANDACLNINEERLCEHCPLNGHMCLMEEDVITVAQHLSPIVWQEFLDVSDDIYKFHEEADRMASEADFRRKFLLEEEEIARR